jgi:hypothetical protein
MPCNARVILKAKATVNTNDILKLLETNSIRVLPDSYICYLNPLVEVTLSRQGNAEFRYMGDDWNEGVQMFSRAITYLKNKGVEVTDAGKPETHRHDDHGVTVGVRA